MTLHRALAPILVLVALLLPGCGRLRSTSTAQPRSASSPRLPPLVVGEPVLDQLTAGAKSANLVICVLDAARADHVGCYGYPLETTPNIDRLAKESVVFRNHFSAYPSTKQSTASLFTGLYADTLRLNERGALDERIFTLEKGLKAAGFETALFSSNFVASPEAGIGADFEHVFAKLLDPSRSTKERITLPDDELWRTPEGLTEVFGKWLAAGRKSRFFAYCHFLPPHNPYNAPDELKQLFAGQSTPAVRRGRFEFSEVMRDSRKPIPFAPQRWSNLYDANMRWGDWGVGEVVRLLREQGLLDNTLLIVTSDHGEAFGEHGYVYHARAVYDEFVHIPMLIRFPGRRLTGEVAALTQTADVLPTVLDLYQIPYPREKVQGRSVLPLLDGGKTALRDYAFATCSGPWASYLVRNSNWSLILYQGGELKALYDLRADPGQTRNVIKEHAGTAAEMIAAFKTFARTQDRPLTEFILPGAEAQPPKAPQGKLSDKARRELKALGYVQ